MQNTSGARMLFSIIDLPRETLGGIRAACIEEMDDWRDGLAIAADSGQIVPEGIDRDAGRAHLRIAQLLADSRDALGREIGKVVGIHLPAAIGRCCDMVGKLRSEALHLFSAGVEQKCARRRRAYIERDDGSGLCHTCSSVSVPPNVEVTL